jgi:hypothetical protein
MRHLNSNPKGSIDTLSNGVHNKLVREKESFLAINSGELRGRTANQSFIVEWQMQSNDAVEFNKKTDGSIETGIYLH